MPCCNSPDTISVIRPSLMPGTTFIGTALPSRNTQTWRDCAVLAPLAADLRVLLRGMRGNMLKPLPALAAAEASFASAGSKRKALLGTSTTSLRCTAVMVAVAVMPGRRVRSVLSTSR